jgi:hypothetical protein
MPLVLDLPDVLVVDPDQVRVRTRLDGGHAARHAPQRLLACVPGLRHAAQQPEQPQQVGHRLCSPAAPVAGTLRGAGRAAPQLAVGVQLRVPAVINLVPVGGRLREAHTGIVQERLS